MKINPGDAHDHVNYVCDLGVVLVTFRAKSKHWRKAMMLVMDDIVRIAGNQDPPIPAVYDRKWVKKVTKKKLAKEGYQIPIVHGDPDERFSYAQQRALAKIVSSVSQP